MILAVFDLQVIPILPIKLRTEWPFCSGEVQNRFSSWWLWLPYWIYNQNNLAIFELQVTQIHVLPTKFQVNWSFGKFRRRFKIYYKNGGHDGHLGFPSGMILAIFDLQVTLTDTSYQVQGFPSEIYLRGHNVSINSYFRGHILWQE